MEIKLNNGVIEATISSLGAELIHLNLLETGLDYMWRGDSTYWGGRSPVLFPIIGSLNHGRLTVKGQDYKMGNHGFARKSDFECLAKSDHSATFRLCQNEATLSQYPYHFNLDLIYNLIGTSVSIRYVVRNNNSEVMPFQLGTHPAFNCPLGSTDRLDQWFLEFEQPETLSRIGLIDNLLDLDNTTLVMDNTNLLPLIPEDFFECAMVFKSIESKHVTLKSNLTPEQITVSFDHFPDLALWQPKGAPFLCIEPWYGHGDPIGFEGDLMEKPDMNHLKAHGLFESELRIRIQ